MRVDLCVGVRLVEEGSGFGFGGKVLFLPSNDDERGFCGKVIADPRATAWVGESSCLKVRP